jgi:hypothetical protein
MDRYASFDLMVNVLPETGDAEMLPFEGCKTAATCGNCTNTSSSKKGKITVEDEDFATLEAQLDDVLAAR